MSYILLFLASFATVGLVTVQQLNISHRKYKSVFFTSVGISLANYFLFKLLPTGNFQTLQFLSFALGGASGAILGMHIHDRVFNSIVV